MKRTFLATLMFLITHNLFGWQSEIRLRMQVTPIPRKALELPWTEVTVDAKGKVKGVQKSGDQDFYKERLLGQLTTREMSQIERQIEETREGELLSRRFNPICLALPLANEKFTADENRILLYEAPVICPDRDTLNSSFAAKQLVQRLRGYYSLFQRLN